MLKFIEIKPNDIKELAKLASEIWHEYFPYLISDEQINYMLNKFQSKNAIINQINNENYTYFYMIFDDKKAGYIGVSRKKDYLFLSKIYITKECRHMGLGTKAFEFIKDFAKNNNYESIRLTVNKNNKSAINVYNKWGFKTIDSVVVDIGNGFVMDDYIMEYATKIQK